MEDLFKDYLFQKHLLVNDEADEGGINYENAFAAMVGLSGKFGIRLENGFELATKEMIMDAARNLGEYVPEPFYLGFPESVRELTNQEKLYDALIHYTSVNGFFWLSKIDHSTFEEVMNKLEFEEKCKEKIFKAIREEEAYELIKADIQQMLSENTRPLSFDQETLVAEAYRKFGNDIVPDHIRCKETAIRFYYHTKNETFAKHLALSDVIKMLRFISYETYGNENLKKLNLRNQDRKFLIHMLDRIFDRMHPVSFEDEIWDCFEKRQIWCGLLHHIHYRPSDEKAMRFVRMIRDGDTFVSHYSKFEQYMADGLPITAAMWLKGSKGEAELLRHLNYILSRCESEDEIRMVLNYVG